MAWRIEAELLWSSDTAELYRAPIPQGMSAKERGLFIKARNAAEKRYDYLFPTDSEKPDGS